MAVITQRPSVACSATNAQTQSKPCEFVCTVYAHISNGVFKFGPHGRVDNAGRGARSCTSRAGEISQSGIDRLKRVCPACAQLDDGTPNYGLAVFLALAVACTAVWASLAGQLVAAFQAAPRAPFFSTAAASCKPSPPKGGRPWLAAEKVQHGKVVPLSTCRSALCVHLMKEVKGASVLWQRLSRACKEKLDVPISRLCSCMTSGAVANCA